MLASCCGTASVWLKETKSTQRRPRMTVVFNFAGVWELLFTVKSLFCCPGSSLWASLPSSCSRLSTSSTSCRAHGWHDGVISWWRRGVWVKVYWLTSSTHNIHLPHKYQTNTEKDRKWWKNKSRWKVATAFITHLPFKINAPIAMDFFGHWYKFFKSLLSRNCIFITLLYTIIRNKI